MCRKPLLEAGVEETGTMDRLFFAYGALFAGLSVASGAFGAHALRERLSPEMLAVFETGSRYEMYHALGLMAVAWAVGRWPGSMAVTAGWCFIAGILLFSGSLHVLAVTGIRWLGAITPIGGLAFLLGWGLLLWTAWTGV
jgi:uncharacterized membrane protein YgdD (TMEM256/DUF423 family)